MDLLNEYDADESSLIIKLGIHSYKTCSNYFENVQFEKEYDDDTVDVLRAEMEKLRSNRDEIEEELMCVRKEHIDTLNAKLSEQQRDFMVMLKSKEESYQSLSRSVFDEVERRTNEKTQLLSNEILVLKERLTTQEDTNKSLQEHNCELEKKYNLQTKGIEFENEIARNMEDVVDTRFNNMWLVEHVGHHMGGKGDIILTHKRTNMRIMIDPKNHKSVRKPDKDKFLLDMRNELNNFNGGIMVSRGTIQGKGVFEENKEGSKKLWYVSNYKVGNEDFLMFLVETMHEQLVGKDDDGLSMDMLKMKYKADYKQLKKEKQLIHNQMKMIEEREKKMIGEYYDYFGCDLQTDMIENNMETSKDDLVRQYLDECVVKDESSKISVSVLQESMIKKVPSISKKKIVQGLMVWLKEKYGHDQKLTGRSTIKGFTIKTETNDILIIDT
jgi:hypothetical protein